MLVLRIFVTLVIASTFVSCAEAQLFRFRSNSNFGARSNAMQQRGYPSRYDASAYQYTQVQPQTNYVPSQRTMVQAQSPACNRQQMNLVPASSVAAMRQNQQRVQGQASSEPQTEVVAVTYRDPYSGRLFQRRYLVQRPGQRQRIAQQQMSDANSGEQLSGNTTQPNLQKSPAQSPKESLSQAAPIGVTTPELKSLTNGGVETTSFEAPATKSTVGASAEFSVLELDGGTEVGGPSSVLDSSLPALDVPVDSSEIPGALPGSDPELELDLPALELEDAK